MTQMTQVTEMASQKIRFFRSRIPSFECTPGCHDCCGPVMASTEEMSRLPVKSDAEHEAALENLSCPHLGSKGCQVYAERPLICRLFGTTPRLACPNGNRPEVMVDPDIDRRIQRFFVETRHVLV
ncbi:YkgJ family cysteine cluster protein [Cupriavidus basilensis]|uniref:YkgJ family cysteine cluster protein n=1 Tax=Cupriavidus basilensis TaxID=68895 RepID=UPI0023E7E28B|nr:YkgJ family cysteine cluster protein [Cupriavidus basilensis]MDF3888459.1 YkgJ family cysteine cluster protein [Cupriavidus basilensis]